MSFRLLGKVTFQKRREGKQVKAGKSQDMNPKGSRVKLPSGPLGNELVVKDNSSAEVRKKTIALINKYGSPKSSNDEYEILQLLGEGGFGTVVKCLKKGSNEILAMKISKYSDVSIFCNERSILQKINADDPDKFNFVRNVENFSNVNFFMIFEMLEKNLLDLMNEEGNRPIPMEGIQYISQQLLIAQKKLRDLKIVHGDLKPGNIMLINHTREPFKIKIIDFGSSIQLPTKNYSSKLGTVYYRAPEIILGIQYNHAVDMWATGCIIVEMLIAHILYPGNSNYDQIRLIDKMQGPFPDYMICSNKVAAEYFCQERDENGSFCRWRLKTPREYLQDTGNLSFDFGKCRPENLDSLFQLRSSVRRGYRETDLDRKFCIDMIKKMLEIDHQNRISPDDALECNFFSRRKQSND